MMQGISTGLGFAEMGAGTAAGTNDPSTTYSALGQKTADSFDALSQKGYGSSAGAGVDGDSHRRAAAASWQDYMNQGIHTGVGFAMAGAGTEAGTNDPATAYATLGKQTADDFDALGYKGEEGAALPVSQQQPVPAVIASASPQGSNSAASQPTSQGGATWQDYMFQGISTGLDFAKAGAGTATSTNDPSTVYASLGEKTSGSFDALNQKSYGSAPAAPGSQRMLFVDHQDRF